MSRESTAQAPPPRQQTSEQRQENQENSFEDDDTDFVLVVNRKKHNVQSVEPHRKQRQSHDTDEEHHNAPHQGRRRKYRDRGGGDQKGFRRREKSNKHDKENINKTGNASSQVQQTLATSPPPPPQPPLPTPSGRSFSVVVACGSTAPPPQKPQTDIPLTDQSNDQDSPVRLTNRQILMVMKPKQESLSGTGPSTSSSIPDTSSLTSDETLDSTDRKTSADVESNEGSSVNNVPVVEYMDAPAPKINPWVANRNAAQVILKTGLPSNVALNGFPSVQQSVREEKKPLTEQPPPTQKQQQKPTPQKQPPSPNSFSQAVSAKKQDTPQQPKTELPSKTQLPPQQDPQPSVYIREMSNGFRPGRGRGSCSASASTGRKIPSRSSVLMKVLSTDNSASSDDWPTLGEAVIIRDKKLSSSGDEESEVVKSEDAVDSSQGKDVEVKSSLDPPSKSPLPQDQPEKSTSPPPHNQTETSSSDNEDDINSASRQRKGSKQKWVPLDMTSAQGQQDNPQPEHKKSGKGRYSKYHTNYHSGYQRAKGKENVAINGGNDYSDYHPRYNHRNQNPHHRSNPQINSRGGANNSTRSRRHHQTQHRSNSTLSLNNHSLMNGHPPPHHHGPFEIITSPTNQPTDYQDFPPDFTTLTPMYPAAVSEFIMPYVTNGYFPTPFTPPAGLLVESGTDVVGGVNIVVAPPQHPAVTQVTFQNGSELTVLTDLVRTQIEYYFSEENLAKDFYLRRKMDKEGYLPVHLIATFPRVKQMTTDYSTVLTAIQTSSTIELTKDLQSVRTTLTPEKWPILDPQQHPQKLPEKCINNNNTPSPSGAETLNPNVPEFVPKSKVVF